MKRAYTFFAFISFTHVIPASDMNMKFIACLPWRIDKVEKYLNKGAHPDSLISDFWDRSITPLVKYGFEQNHQKLTALLLLYGTDVTAYDNKGDTVLHRLITRNGITPDKEPFIISLITSLKKCGLDMNIKNSVGQTPLIAVCAKSGYINNINSVCRVTKVLLDNGADPNIGYQDEKKGYITPLYNALQASNMAPYPNYDTMPLVQLLLQKNVQPMRNDLYIALHNKGCSLTVVELLLDNKADPNEIDARGYTLLHEIAHGTSEATPICVQLLLQKGAKKDLITFDGLTPLDIAQQSKEDSLLKFKEHACSDWADHIIKVHETVINMLSTDSSFALNT